MPRWAIPQQSTCRSNSHTVYLRGLEGQVSEMAEDLPEPLDIIAVGAHPDDVEIGCGGTLARLVKQGYRVGIIDLTDGEPTPESPGPEVRLAEAQAAAETLGVHVREIMELTNRRLFDTFENRVALAKLFRRYRPRLVLGIADRTPMASPDHWQARQITDAAVFYSRLTKWDEHFDGLPVHTITKQLWYPLGLSSLNFPTEPGSFVVDISDTLAVKLQSVLQYQTQFAHREERISRLVNAHAASIGIGAGIEAGELLISPNLVRVADPLETFCT